jgi:hypothetical protein
MTQSTEPKKAAVRADGITTVHPLQSAFEKQTSSAQHTESDLLEHADHRQDTDRIVQADTRASAIRALNDAFRQTLVGGQVLITSGIAALGGAVQTSILEAVQRFDRFSEDNDPYGEHDFGSLLIASELIFFKIEYYDRHCLMGSSEPTDPSVTTRVLTIMLANEY